MLPEVLCTQGQAGGVLTALLLSEDRSREHQALSWEQHKLPVWDLELVASFL